MVLGLRNGTIDMQSAMDRSPGGSQLPMCKLHNATGTAAEVWAKLADGTMTAPERIGKVPSLQVACCFKLVMRKSWLIVAMLSTRGRYKHAW